MSGILRNSVVAALAVFTFGGCALFQPKLEKPKVQLQDVNVEDPNLKEATFVFNFKVENPNSREIAVDKLDYTLNLNDKEFAKGTVDKNLKVAANDVAVIPLPIRIRYSDLYESVLGFVSSGATKYNLAGAVQVGFFSVPFSKTGELKLTDIK